MESEVWLVARNHSPMRKTRDMSERTKWFAAATLLAVVFWGDAFSGITAQGSEPDSSRKAVWL
jgi:hypothetical protein